MLLINSDMSVLLSLITGLSFVLVGYGRIVLFSFLHLISLSAWCN